MQKIDLLGVGIDKISMAQSVEQVEHWIKAGGKHYIVTPNVEFLMAAQEDKEFQEILNKADLVIPDSSRFGWANDLLKEKNVFKKILKWPFFIFPKAVFLPQMETVAGTDLMNKLIGEAVENDFTVGFLGGGRGVVEKLAGRLKELYPKLKVTFTGDGGVIDTNGISQDTRYKVPSTDLLFVAFGQVKQEKWIAKNLNRYPVKIMMGVGGAFDFLSGGIPRAPRFIRVLGFEWMFRLIIQPWRIKRFGSLLKFVFLVTKLRY